VRLRSRSVVTTCTMEDNCGYHHPMGVNEFAFYRLDDYQGGGIGDFYWPSDPPCVTGSCNAFTINSYT
jgi:hypothetical protein